MTVSEDFLISYDSSSPNGAFSIEVINEPAITFHSCPGDGTLTGGYTADQSSKNLPGDIEEYVTGKPDCIDEETEALEKMGFIEQDDEEWVPVIGKSFLYYPSISSDDLNALLEKSPNQIIRRRCFSCDLTHKDMVVEQVRCQTKC